MKSIIIHKNFSGDIDNFSGEEIIAQDSKEVYRAKYMGEFVDHRKQRITLTLFSKEGTLINYKSPLVRGETKEDSIILIF